MGLDKVRGISPRHTSPFLIKECITYRRQDSNQSCRRDGDIDQGTDDDEHNHGATHGGHGINVTGSSASLRTWYRSSRVYSFRVPVTDGGDCDHNIVDRVHDTTDLATN